MDMNPPEDLVERKDKTPPKKWNYETFKEYLLSQARGKEFLLPLDDFPAEMDLNGIWHGAFNKLRDETAKDQIERVALVGYNLSQRAIYLPTDKVIEVPWQWEKSGHVARMAIDRQMALARIHGAEGFAGILHSHPAHDLRLFKFEIKTGRLSAGDLHIVLGGYYGSMIGVVDGGVNSLAFKTKESIKPKETQERFYDLWEGLPHLRGVDLLIAQKYKLALYKGNVNQNLKRVA